MSQTQYRLRFIMKAVSAACGRPVVVHRHRRRGAALRAARSAGLLALGLALPLIVAAPAFGAWSCIETDYEWTKERYVGSKSGEIDTYRIGPGDYDWAERPNREDPLVQFGYAECQILLGDKFEGMAVLHHIADHYTDVRRVKAAWLIAEYLQKNGDVKSGRIDPKFLNEAIEAYKRVKFFVKLHEPDYPFGGPFVRNPNRSDGSGFRDHGVADDEGNDWMYISTIYRIPLLYMVKYWYGWEGSDNVHKLTSRSYGGDRNLDTYPDYAPYTLNSLTNVIEFAEDCRAVMTGPRVHLMNYDVEDYERGRRLYNAACQVLKDAAAILYPLEQKRLVLLSTDSCIYDILKCDEYKAIYGEIDVLLSRGGDDLRAVFNN